LDVPWGLAFLPDGTALVSLRDQERIIAIRDGVVTDLGSVPDVVAGGEGGLLGLAVSPTFEQDRSVYAYLTTDGDNRIVRMTLPEDLAGLGAPEVVLSGIARAGNHDGGRLVFGPDGMLYASTGDAANRPSAQDPASLNGKILRLTPQGAPAPGNPDPASVVYSLGHRNVEGLAFDANGRLWASEFGQDTWDELNLIQPGGNYGWPEVEGAAGDPRFIDPVAQWPTSEASPSGLAIIGDAAVLAGLRGQQLWVVPINASGLAGEPVALLTGQYGRLRTVALAPDGSVWLFTNNTDGRGNPAADDDKILRLTA
jgi:glucose/arabinose dehydrogenase